MIIITESEFLFILIIFLPLERIKIYYIITNLIQLTSLHIENEIKYLSKIIFDLEFCINEVKLKKKERARLDERTN